MSEPLRDALYQAFDDEAFMAAHLNARSLTDAVLAIVVATPPQPSAGLRAALERYGKHDYGCASTKSDEGLDVWAVVECTCPQTTLYGAHDLGCPRSLAFIEWRKAEDSKPRPECTCGFDAALAANPDAGEGLDPHPIDPWTLKRAANTLRAAYNRMPEPPSKSADAEAYRAGWLDALRLSADELDSEARLRATTDETGGGK